MTMHVGNFGEPRSAVVALHSTASSGLQWKALKSDLEGRHDVIAPDLPGYGKNAISGDSVPCCVADAAAPIIDDISKFGQPVHLVGHSYGGMVALKISLARPDLIKSLTLYEPAGFHLLKTGEQGDRQLHDEISHVAGTLNESLEIGRPEIGMECFINYWNGDKAWDQLAAHSKQKIATLAPTIMADFSCIFAEDWPVEELRALEIPTLMLMGLESPAMAQRVACIIADTLPNARLAMLPELTHMAPVFEPQWVNPRIIEHVVTAERPALDCRWPTQTAA